MSYTYDTYVIALQTLVVSQAPDVPFTNILPSAIDYAEQRLYRELNLLNTVQTDETTTLTDGERNATIPNTFVVVNNLNVITPAGARWGTGTRVPLPPVSRVVLDLHWPSNVLATRGIPTMFAMTTQWDLVLGPSPDDAYVLEVVGTYRPAALSASNQTTFLSERLPDLFVAASMVFMSLYQRNFASAQGQSGNDPMMGGNWEAQYQSLFASAATEEARKMFAAASWTSHPVSPQAQPQRG